jgi:hypothetical protein
LVATFNLLAQLGFNDSLLRAKNAAIPIAYYIHKNNLAKSIVKTTYDKTDKENISKWLSMSLIKGMFGGQSDGMLKTLRDVIKDSTNNKFPLDEIINKFKGNVDKNYAFTDDIIDSLLEEEYGSAVCSLTLMLLYPAVVIEHGRSIAEDHMHPKTVFETQSKLDSLGLTINQETFYRNNYNTVLNLQLLDEATNKSKSDTPLDQWAKEKSKSNADLYVDATVSLDIANFENFIESRRTQLKNQLKTLIV